MSWQLVALGFSAVSAAGQISAGYAAEEEDKLTAFNIKTDKAMNAVAAAQAARARLEEYQLATSTNIASFAAAGRDVSNDKSVEAFLKRQEDVIGEDLKRIQNQTQWESVQGELESLAVKRRGRNARVSSLFNAAGTIGQGIYNYNVAKS